MFFLAAISLGLTFVVSIAVVDGLMCPLNSPVRDDLYAMKGTINNMQQSNDLTLK